jgi:hypothetical protein
MTSHPAERTNEPQVTLAEWGDRDDDEPGELVNGRLVGAAEGLVEEVPGCQGLALNLDALWDEASHLDGDATPAAPEPRRLDAEKR